jgi:hypothetical protein
MTKYLLLVVALTIAFPAVIGQSIATDGNIQLLGQSEPHTSHVTDIIDGSEHPELIPDVTAYRLFFVAITTNIASKEASDAKQRAYVRKLGLQPAASEQALKILLDFKVRHDQLIRNYNDSAEVALLRGEAPDYAGFLLQVDALVEDTRRLLKDSLSLEELNALDASIQGEKKFMRVAKKPR